VTTDSDEKALAGLRFGRLTVELDVDLGLATDP
jgi:hypothetical protein